MQCRQKKWLTTLSLDSDSLECNGFHHNESEFKIKFMSKIDTY